jgi:hypothetical protein
MYKSGIPPVFKNINSVMLYGTMKKVFILALIVAVCMCSVDASGVETEEDRLSARIENMSMCSGDVSGMETEEDGFSALIENMSMCSEEDVSGMETEEDGRDPIVPQKSSDDEGNVNDSQNKQKGVLDPLPVMCGEGLTGKEGEIKLRRMAKRFKEEKAEVEFFRRLLKERESFTEQNKERLKMFLCEILEVDTGHDLESVVKESHRIGSYVDYFRDLHGYAKDPDIWKTVKFMAEVEAKLKGKKYGSESRGLRAIPRWIRSFLSSVFRCGG